ncbi:MAG: type II secretion system protein J, partial [Lachnospiraceae bacterium]
MKKNDRGYSLVELIVAFAIFAVVGIAVFGFMTYSSNNYRRTNTDIKLQYEQQLAVNQVRDLIVESTSAIYFDESSKTLAIYSLGTNDEGNV